MATYDNCIILYWNQGKVRQMIQISKNTNTPLTQTASGTKTCQVYSVTIEALKACTSNFCGEHILQQPDHQENPNDSDEYIADDNLLLGSHVRVRGLEEGSADDIPIKVNNARLIIYQLSYQTSDSLVGKT